MKFYFTTPEQAKILLAHGYDYMSSDMYYNSYNYTCCPIASANWWVGAPNAKPCWSIGALMDLIPYQFTIHCENKNTYWIKVEGIYKSSLQYNIVSALIETLIRI